MSHAVRVHETGDASVLQWEEVSVAEPAAGEVCLRHTAIGLNFIDVYFRASLTPSASDPVRSAAYIVAPALIATMSYAGP